MRELPRQLTLDQLAELFEGVNPLTERLAAAEDPLGQARQIARDLSDEEKRAVLDAHPAIGQRAGLSARSRTEQGSDDDPATLAELARLNREYEQRFGFRFVVFVNRRPGSEIVPILRERLNSTREQELDTALDELVAIALDRWQHSPAAQ